ncbi:MAG: hypothetical protein R6X12_08090 [bacterium]
MASRPAAGARLLGRGQARLPRPLPGEERLRLLGRVARSAGARSFLVGGPVRDILLGRSSPDSDLAVEGDIRRVGDALATRLGGRFLSHARFLTGTLLLPDGGRIDVARCRTERYQRPAVLPAVLPAPVEADLSRRDFTVNAMAVELTPGRFGRLIDPHSGQTDLAGRVIRVLHPASFTDDPTRIFRAIRFAVRLEFEIEAGTLGLMRAAVAAGLPGLLTPGRVLHELRCFCAEEHAPRMFEAARREGLFEACFARRPLAAGKPRLWRGENETFIRIPERTPGAERRGPGPGFIAGLARLGRRTREPELLYVYLLAALPDNPRFPVTRGQREAARAVRRAPGLVRRLARARRPSTVYRLLRPLPVPALKVIAATSSPAAEDTIGTYLHQLADVEPLLGGRDLSALGLRPGPAFRATIERLRQARLDGRVRTREDELALARRLVRRQQG